MDNRANAAQCFAEAFKEGLIKKYQVIPSNSFIATQFNLRAYGTSGISRETARKWTKGLAFPAPGNLIVLIKWLKLNPSDFLEGLVDGTGVLMPHLQHPNNTEMHSNIYAQKILDSIAIQVAVIDSLGVIVQVNQSWREFALLNSNAQKQQFFIGSNYLEVCENTMGPGCQTACDMASGIRQILAGELEEFAIKYDCDSSTNKYWYVARVVPLNIYDQIYAVVSHQELSKASYLKLKL